MDTNVVYCDGPEAAAAVMSRYGATHVLSSGGVPDCDAEPTDFAGSPLFETIYAAEGVAVWHRAGS